MSGAQEYYDSLIAQGYTEQKADEYTKIHFPDFSIRPEDQENEEQPISEDRQFKSTSNQFLMPVVIATLAIVLVFVAMFSNTWMNLYESDDGYELNFGFTEFSWDEYGVESGTESYSIYSDDNELFSDAEKAGNVALIFLWLGVLTAIGSLLLFVLNTFAIYESKYSPMLAFFSGGMIIVGIFVWFYMFPNSENPDDETLELGGSFFIALFGGIAIIVSGLFQRIFTSQPQELILGTSNQELINSALVPLSLIFVSITLILISMFTSSWAVDSEDDGEYRFGLSNLVFNYDESSYTLDYSSEDCMQEQECSEIKASGMTGLIILWISVAISILTLVLIYMNSFQVYKTNFGVISAIVGGCIAIIGAIVWYFMFPTLDDISLDPSPGISFYLAIIGGILSIICGVYEAKSLKDGGSLTWRRLWGSNP